MARVAVEQQILAWAIDRSGLPLPELQTKLPKISEWLTGASQPTLRQLETLARATETPLGFFFLKKTPPEEHLPIPHFRTCRDEAPGRPSPELLATVHMMERRQAWMREYLIGEDGSRSPSWGLPGWGNRRPWWLGKCDRRSISGKAGLLGSLAGGRPWALYAKPWTLLGLWSCSTVSLVTTRIESSTRASFVVSFWWASTPRWSL